METNHSNQDGLIAGTVRFLIPLALGLILGAFLYSRFAGSDLKQRPPAADVHPDGPDGREAEPNTVQIGTESQKDLGIAVEAAVNRSLQEILTATGIVSEDPGRVAHIRPLARGLIEKAFARLGDRVSAGDPLVEYDNIELGVAIGEFLSAKAAQQQSLTDLEVKKKILDRSREMLRAGALARTTYDLREAECKDAEARAAAARATTEKIEEQIHRYGWTDQDLANLPAKQGHSITHSVLKAPFSGVITSFHVVEGEVVEPSTELLAITDMSSLWVLADVFEKDLAHIRPGKAVQVRVASYPGKVFQGRITYVTDALDPKTRTAKARCHVQNVGGLLKLEMFATVEMPVERTIPVLAVPDSSIQQLNGRPVVFVRVSETDFQKREVQTGIASGGFTEIRSGLEAGEPVVTSGSFVVKTEFLKNLIGERE